MDLNKKIILNYNINIKIKLKIMSEQEDDEYEANVRKILKDLVFHTIKNRPKNIVRNFY